MPRNETIEVLKEGKPECDHSWMHKLNFEAPEETEDFKRICRLCGRVEHITCKVEKLDYDQLYAKFYGTEG